MFWLEFVAVFIFSMPIANQNWDCRQYNKTSNLHYLLHRPNEKIVLRNFNVLLSP